MFCRAGFPLRIFPWGRVSYTCCSSPPIILNVLPRSHNYSIILCTMLLSVFIVVIWDRMLWKSVSSCSTKRDSFLGISSAWLSSPISAFTILTSSLTESEPPLGGSQAFQLFGVTSMKLWVGTFRLLALSL